MPSSMNGRRDIQLQHLLKLIGHVRFKTASFHNLILSVEVRAENWVVDACFLTQIKDAFHDLHIFLSFVPSDMILSDDYSE